MSIIIPRIEKAKQNFERRRKTLSVTVKYKLFNKPTIKQFHTALNTHIDSKGSNEITKEIVFYIEEKFWDENEIYSETMGRGRNIISGVPLIELDGHTTKWHGIRSRVTFHMYSLKDKAVNFPRPIKENEDFKITIEGVTSYEYEIDTPFSWDDVQPIEN
ncbi:hypothetical protein [Salinicoccus sp. CNSTN-B1]